MTALHDTERGGRLGRALMAGLLLVALLAGCGRSQREAEPETPRSGPVAVTAQSGDLGVPYVEQDRVYGLPAVGSDERLAAPVQAPLTGTYSPSAVPRRPGGGALAYNAFRDERPVVRLRDARAERDEVIADGAFSVAWRSDGVLAYFKGLTRRVRDLNRFRGHLVVTGGRERAVRWTPEPGRYIAAAWGGDRLVAYRLSTTGAPDLLVFDGPGRVRVLAERSVLVALSPDGERALVAQRGDAGATVSVVALTSGAVERRLALDRTATRSRQPVTDVASGGSWRGDLVVATTNSGLIVLRIGASAIAVEQVLRFDLAAFPVGVNEPQLQPGGRRIAAWAELAPRPRQVVPDAAILVCDRLALRCRQGRSAPGLAPPRPIYNPSRP